MSVEMASQQPFINRYYTEQADQYRQPAQSVGEKEEKVKMGYAMKTAEEYQTYLRRILYELSSGNLGSATGTMSNQIILHLMNQPVGYDFQALRGWISKADEMVKWWRGVTKTT
jgi:hypothetical protein